MRDQNGSMESKNNVACARYQYFFSNFEEDLDKNQFKNYFLRLYHSKLVYYLMQIFSLNKSAIKCFLFDEFIYSGPDWYTGKRWSISLREQIKYRHFF